LELKASSAVRRKFGENYVSRSTVGLEAEGHQRLWIYVYINNAAKEALRMKNTGKQIKEVRKY